MVELTAISWQAQFFPDIHVALAIHSALVLDPLNWILVTSPWRTTKFKIINPKSNSCFGKTYQNTQRTSDREFFWLLAHSSKQVLWMLFPQAPLHHKISSLSGWNSVKQIGQSPEISLRLLLSREGWPKSCSKHDWGMGAWEKISRNS